MLPIRSRSILRASLPSNGLLEHFLEHREELQAVTKNGDVVTYDNPNYEATANQIIECTTTALLGKER